jgi:hypothetical protein
MTQEKATKRPWSVSVETEAEDGLTITIPEIGRCLHDWEWAEAEEWERDLANADLIVTAVNERDALLSEVATLRAEALKGICVYCGYIEQYESLEQKASEVGNAMRVAHIRQCEARPEAKLIAFSQQLIDEVAQLREVAEYAERELAHVVHGAGRNGGRYEEALNKLRAALAGRDR